MIMKSQALKLFKSFACLALLTSSAQAQETQVAPWSTKTVKVESMSFSIPEFCSIEKVSSDELCTWPIVATFAPDGSLILAESVWNINTKETVQQQLVSRPHRIVRLRDTNNDGKFDQRQVVADTLSFPEGVLCIGRDIYVTAPPQIWKLTDSDGDGVCEKREVWFDALTLTGCANDLHGPWLGPDGWIYWTKSAFAEQSHQILSGQDWKSKASHLYRRHPNGGPIDPVMTGGMDNLVDIAWLPNGDRFFCATFLHHPRHGFRDGIGAATYGALYGKPHAVLDGHPRTGPLMNPTADLGPAAPAGLLYLDSISNDDPTQGVPQGYLLCAQFNLHQISLHPLTKKLDQSQYHADSYPLVSSDRIDFHPVDVLTDADGSILIVDTGGWYDLCCPSSGTDQRIASGGIYRLKGLAPKFPKTKRPASLQNLTKLSIELTQATADQQATIKQAYDSQVIAAMSDPDPSVAMLACHLASLHRIPTARAKAQELLISPNASLRRSAAEILGRLGIGSELPELLNQINQSTSDRTLSHSLIYAMIEGAQDQSLLESLDQAVESKQLLASTTALVRVLEHRGKLTDQYGDLVLQLALVQEPQTSEFGLSVLESHPQWSKSILDTVAKRTEKSKSTLSQPLLTLLARWSDNPEVANWVAEKCIANASPDIATPHELTTSLLSKLNSKPVPEAWVAPIAKLIALSPENMAASWQSALENRTWKGNTQAIQDAILPKLRKIVSSDLQAGSKNLDILQWAAAMPKGSVLDEPIERFLIQVALASEDQDSPDSKTHRPLAWQSLSKLTLGSESSRELLLERLTNAAPLELPVAIEAYAKSSTPEQDLKLLDALSKLPGAKTLSVDGTIGKFKDRPAEIQKRWKDALEAWTRPDQDVQDKVQQWLGKLKDGDPKLGYHVFRSSKAACSACHQVGYVGGNVGPVLSKIGQSRSKRDLLEAILFPSARLEQAYRSTKVQLQDGEIVQGLVVSESPKELILQTAADKRRSIDVHEIELREPSNVSIMPAGLESQLSIQELSDLIAFLENAK
jgi:putative heme-binding domain-containing protein